MFSGGKHTSVDMVPANNVPRLLLLEAHEISELPISGPIVRFLLGKNKLRFLAGIDSTCI